MAGGIQLAPLVTKVKVDLNSFKSDMDKLAAEGVRAADHMTKKMSDTRRVGEAMVGVGSTLTKKVTAPIVGLAAACTKFYVDAETGFAKVGTLIGDKTPQSVNKMKKAVIEASNASGVAVGEFNEALYQSISAGIESGKSVKFTADMTQLARGGFTTASAAVDVVTTALNAYGLGADEATAISDKLITTQNLGKTTVDELASSLGKVIPTANAFGVNMDQVSATMAVMTKNGIATAEATTYFNAMLNELGKSGTQASTILREKTGKSFKELMDTGIPLSEVLAILDDEAKASGLSLADMFGSAEAGKAALTLMKDGGVEYVSILKQMEDSAGATQKAFDEMNDTPAVQMQMALNQLKNAGIGLGQAFAPVIMKISKTIGDLALKFQGLSPETKEFISKVLVIVATVGPLLVVVGKGIVLFTQLRSALMLISAIAPATGTAFTVMLGPIGLIIAAIAAVVVIGVALYKNWDKIKEGAANMVKGVKEAWGKLTGGAKELGQKIAGAFSNMAKDASASWNKFKEDSKEKWNGIKTSFGEGMADIKGKVKAGMDIATKYTASKLSEMKLAYDTHGGGMRGAVAATMTAVKGLFKDGFDAANNATGGALGRMVGSVKDKMNSVINTVKGVIDKVKAAFNFKWSLPSLKLPHFSASGKFSLNPLSVPKFNIKWYKAGGIMTDPTMFGINGNSLMAGGEAGAEAILPLDPFYDKLQNFINRGINLNRAIYVEENRVGFTRIETVLVKYLPLLRQLERQIVLDDGALVGKLTPKIDSELGQATRQKERGW